MSSKRSTPRQDRADEDSVYTEHELNQEQESLQIELRRTKARCEEIESRSYFIKTLLSLIKNSC